MKSQAYKGHLAMLGANILWGLMSPVSKAVLIAGPISALSLTTFRMVGAAVIFWLASLFTKKEHVNHQDLMKLFFAALLGIVLNQGSFIFGVSLTSPINASIVTTTTPIITMIIAAFYLKEPVTGKKVIGIFVGAAGALLLILSSQSAAAGGGKSSNIWGDLLCLLAQFSFSFYFVLFKGLIGKYSPITLMKWMIYLRFHLYDTVHLQSYFSDRLCKPASGVIPGYRLRCYWWNLPALFVYPYRTDFAASDSCLYV